MLIVTLPTESILEAINDFTFLPHRSLALTVERVNEATRTEVVLHALHPTREGRTPPFISCGIAGARRKGFHRGLILEFHASNFLEDPLLVHAHSSGICPRANALEGVEDEGPDGGVNCPTRHH